MFILPWFRWLYQGLLYGDCVSTIISLGYIESFCKGLLSQEGEQTLSRVRTVLVQNHLREQDTLCPFRARVEGVARP